MPQFPLRAVFVEWNSILVIKIRYNLGLLYILSAGAAWSTDILADA